MLGLQSLTLALGSMCFEFLARRCWLLPEQPCTQGCPKQLGGLCLCHMKARAGLAVSSLPVLSQGCKGPGGCLFPMWIGVARLCAP